MKKVIIFIVVVVGLLFLSDFIYKTYRQNVLTNDKAVLFVYVNLNDEDIKHYFGLDEATYEDVISSNYSISCVIPEERQLHLINVRHNTPVDYINCEQEFDVMSQLEMRKSYHNGYKLRLELRKPESSKNIAYKDVYAPWDYGKINHIVLDKDRAYKYCSK